MSEGSSTPGEEPDEENPFAGPSGPSRAGPSRTRSDGVRYAAVGRIVGRMFLCWHHHPLLDGDWGPTPQQLHAVAQRVLRSATTLERFPRLSVSDPAAGMVHYDTDGTYVYLVVCAANYPQRVAFKCLAELKAAIPANFGERMHTAAEGGLNKGAKKLLAEACSAYEDASKADKVTRVMGQVDEVKDLVQESISELMATRENLEVLEDKTHTLRSEAAGFSRRAVTLRRHMWWRNCKMKILCFVVIAIVLCYILVPLIIQMQESR